MRNGSLWIRPRLHDGADFGDTELLAAGVTRIFSEKVSGAAARRPELERVLDELESGDVLVVCKLDRLARSTLDLLRIVDQIGREDAGFKYLSDTTTSAGRFVECVHPSEDSIGRQLKPMVKIVETQHIFDLEMGSK